MPKQTFSYWRYSPLLAGGFLIPVAGLIRIFVASIGNSAMPRIWLLYMIVGPIMGLILHFASTRVLFGRILDFSASVLLLAALFAFATTILQSLSSISLSLLWPAGVGLLVGTAFVVGFIRDQRSWFRAQLPCGYDGQLDERTGRVDPYASTPRQSARPTRRGLLKNPTAQIITGIVFVQLATAFLPNTGKLTVLVLLLTYLVAVFAFGAGRVASVCVATWRWERLHGKQIHVAR